MADLSGAARALGRVPSGLFVLTAGSGGAATGILVSFVQQVGFAPPAVACAIHRDRLDLLALLRRERAFCLSVLGDGDRELLRRFAAGVPDGSDPFAGLDLATSAVGVPYLTAACAHLACRLVGEAPGWSDHVVVCGEVVDGGGTGGQPWVHLRGNGLSY